MSSEKYNDAFYALQKSGSYRSATIYLEYLFQTWKPQSVADLGCGVGTWLSVCAEQGVSRLQGYDGAWNSQEKMIHQSINFTAADLNQSLEGAETFELAISLEVAEHCLPDNSQLFVDNLSRLSDAILFSAAYTYQPGVDHINTRPHSFWAKMFESQGYVVFDIFRQAFWMDDRVEPWYRQNTFLYVKPSHPLFIELVKRDFKPMKDLRLMDAVHPWLFNLYVQRFLASHKELEQLKQSNGTSA